MCGKLSIWVFLAVPALTTLRDRGNLFANKKKQNLFSTMKSVLRVRRFSTAVRPFEAIPGPKYVPWEMFPGGKLYNKTFPEIHKHYRAKYGDLVKLPGFVGRPNIVISFSPDDFATVFRAEDQWPIRPAFKPMRHYRKTIRPDIFRTGGLLAE